MVYQLSLTITFWMYGISAGEAFMSEQVFL